MTVAEAESLFPCVTICPIWSVFLTVIYLSCWEQQGLYLQEKKSQSRIQEQPFSHVCIRELIYLFHSLISQYVYLWTQTMCMTKLSYK